MLGRLFLHRAESELHATPVIRPDHNFAPFVRPIGVPAEHQELNAQAKQRSPARRVMLVARSGNT
jgi:hypothetical protein